MVVDLILGDVLEVVRGLPDESFTACFCPIGGLQQSHDLLYNGSMKVQIVCLMCGKTFECKPSRAQRAKFCSPRCFYESRKNRRQYTCGHCGKIFEVIASRAKYGRAKHCSPKCQYAAISSRPSKAKVNCLCLNCGKTFIRYRSWLNRKGGGRYCSRECRDKHRVGKNHPGFIDGSGVSCHGPNWQAQRRKALKRDGHICQHCHMTQEESDLKYGLALAVHHVQPSRIFGEDYLAANSLSNLITLCFGCHRIAEAKLVHCNGR